MPDREPAVILGFFPAFRGEARQIQYDAQRKTAQPIQTTFLLKIPFLSLGESLNDMGLHCFRKANKL